MAFRQELAQKQFQKMVLSPQMQQALHILQLPLMELRQTVQQELIQNPALEEVQQKENTGSDEVSMAEEHEDLVEKMEEIARSQELWEEYLRNFNYTAEAGQDDEKNSYVRERAVSMPGLQKHLLQQLRFSGCPDCDIGELIVGNIDEEGYLRTPIMEIAQEAGCEPEKAEKVLELVQTFEPAGVGARNLRECLLIQLKARKEQDPVVLKIVSEHIADIEKKRYPRIAEELGVEIGDVVKAAEVIRNLQPKPGYKFSQDSPQYVVPDVTVKKIDDEHQVVVNDDDIPLLRISPFYRKLLKNSSSLETREYVAEKLKSALWFIKNIEQRKLTVHRVAECIVKNQKGFFEKGISHIRPLKLKDIAADLNLHESTISRVTTSKYMETAHGIFELKYFFSGALRSSEGGKTSTRSVRAKISDLIGNENPKEPLPDNRVVELMKKEGISIARRTVAKYRKQLRILPANLRKQY